MRFIEDRISVICNELKELAFVKKEPVKGVVYKKGLYFYPYEAEQSAEPWEEFDSKTMHWYGPDEHYWFRAEYTVPKSMDGKTLYLKVATQVDHWDYAKNPQFLLFVNGQMTQGMDLNHQTVMLERCAKEGETYTIDLQGYTGVMFAELTFTMETVEVDETINEIYYDIVVPLQGFSRMQEDDKVRKDLRTILNNTVNLLDLRTPYSEEFYQSIEEAHNYIQKALYEDMSGYEDVIASCIGHTHIDVAWLWTVAQTREKVARSFSTVLKYMDEYPEYKFMSSQPALYQFLKERYPETYEKIKERVKEGRWEPEGGMWVEADCNLTSGESLVRQFLYGKKFFKDEFGIDSRILWLPDVFGYSGALPQIMKKSGIKYFMTTKLAWNQINKVPYDTMMWRGIDGSEIFTHLITTLISLQLIMVCCIQTLFWADGIAIRTRILTMIFLSHLDMAMVAAVLQEKCWKLLNVWKKVFVEFQRYVRSSPEIILKSLRSVWKEIRACLYGKVNFISNTTEEPILLWEEINALTADVSSF